MSAKNLDDFYNKYTNDDPEGLGERNISFSLKISGEMKIKLEALSHHLGVKKTPLLGEIAEAAVGEMYERFESEMDEANLRGVAEELEDYYKSGGR